WSRSWPPPAWDRSWPEREPSARSRRRPRTAEPRWRRECESCTLLLRCRHGSSWSLAPLSSSYNAARGRAKRRASAVARAGLVGQSSERDADRPLAAGPGNAQIHFGSRRRAPDSPRELIGALDRYVLV